MTNEEIRRYLEQQSESKFQKFTSSLIPGTDHILGVRIPKIRALAKQIAAGNWREYLTRASDASYEEIMLQGFVIGYARGDIEEMLSHAAAFVPKIRDWSVNDCFCNTFKMAAGHRERVWDFLMQYREADTEFEQRFLAVMLMDYFLTEEYIGRVFEVWDSLSHPGYYRKMGVAWGVATAYAKFPKETRGFLAENHLDDATYNMAIQKMLESYRVPGEEKELLRQMKRK